ncbi:TRAP transporter substrate-binding protein DctP, partial [bacterium]|nr:TRAP transporter substrate-binding protein DctP [bacterium]
MKRLLLVALAITVVSGLVLGGLSKADAKTLQYEIWLPPKVPEYKTMLAFYKGLENATKGEVKVQFNPGGAMGKPGGTYQRTLRGINNIGHFNPGFNTGVFPMWDIFNYPVRGPSSEQLARFQLAMYDKGYFDKEFSKVKISALFNVGSYVIFSNKKLTTINDLKGLKVRTISEGWVELCKVVGAVPVSLPTGEIFVALQKGIVDAVAIIWDASHVFKLNEVSKYVSELYLMSSTHIEAWNKKSWENLPQAGKDYINANWKEYSVNCAK